ncbi:MAG TPA: response regulator [Candidatus Acidoferrum sp.]|nr:response regulator [Candidatus Acidoferrum sp.]
MSAQSSPGPVNILMVDDQPAKLLSYEVMLEELGENLLKASSGREALEMLLKTDVAVVLMDVSMPELDGFQLAEMIREHPRFQKIAIIFISAVHLTDLDRLKGYQRGAVDYISVPVIPDLLRAKVSVFAELHRQARQLEVLNQELRRLSHSLMTAQDEERRRISRELHDGLGQDLTAVKMMLGGLVQPNQLKDSTENKTIAEVLSMMDSAIEQVRTMSHLLHPPLLDEMGLLSALRWYTEGFAKRSGVETVLDLPKNFPRLEPEIEMAIFKIVQESLTNVFRHAEANRAVVQLEERDGCALVSIEDNGKGIGSGAEELHPNRYGIGVIGIKQRAAEYDGQVTLRNTGSGTRVEVKIPLPVPPPQTVVPRFSKLTVRPI